MQTDDSSYNYDNCTNENRITNVLQLEIFCDIHQHTYTENVGDLIVSVKQTNENHLCFVCFPMEFVYLFVVTRMHSIESIQFGMDFSVTSVAAYGTK